MRLGLEEARRPRNKGTARPPTAAGQPPRRRVVVVAGQYPNPMYLRAGVRFAAPQSRGRYRGLSCAARSVFACHTYIPPRSAQERLRSLLTGARNSSPLRKRRPPTVPARETRRPRQTAPGRTSSSRRRPRRLAGYLTFALIFRNFLVGNWEVIPASRPSSLQHTTTPPTGARLRAGLLRTGHFEKRIPCCLCPLPATAKSSLGLPVASLQAPFQDGFIAHRRCPDRREDGGMVFPGRN